MTTRDLLHHVFPWEVAIGVERLDIDDQDADTPPPAALPPQR